MGGSIFVDICLSFFLFFFLSVSVYVSLLTPHSSRFTLDHFQDAVYIDIGKVRYTKPEMLDVKSRELYEAGPNGSKGNRAAGNSAASLVRSMQVSPCPLMQCVLESSVRTSHRPSFLTPLV